MKFSVETREGRLIIRVHENRIDAACAIQFKDQMRELAVPPADTVILDLSEVLFLDSSGLGAVVAVMKHLGPERKLELAGLTPAVDRVFRLTRMNSVFRIHAEVPGHVGRSRAI